MADESINPPTPPTPPDPTPLPVVEVTHIADLQKAVDAHYVLEIDYGGTRYKIKGRRLRPRESAILEDVIRSAMPGVQRGEKPENDRLVYDEAYMQRKARAQIVARAMAIYWCIPIVAAGKLLEKRDDIVEYVQGLWTESILATIWEVLQDGGVRRAELIDFISGPSSPTS